MDYDKLIEQLNAWNEQHLSVVCGGKHFACDYLCENEDCIVVRAATALSTLQIENQASRNAANGFKAENEKLRAELDAAIKQLHGHCPACTHYTPNHNEGLCRTCKHEYYNLLNNESLDNWEWRGPQKED